MHKLGSLPLLPSRRSGDDVRLTFLQDIFEAVSSASILHRGPRPPVPAGGGGRSRPSASVRPDFDADNPVNSRSLSIFYVDLYSSALPCSPLRLLICCYATEETSPTGNMGKAKKLGRSDMIYGLGPSLEGEGKKPDTEPNTPNIPFTTPVGRLLLGTRQTTVLAERSASLSVSCLAKGYAHGETAS